MTASLVKVAAASKEQHLAADPVGPALLHSLYKWKVLSTMTSFADIPISKQPLDAFRKHATLPNAPETLSMTLNSIYDA